MFGSVIVLVEPDGQQEPAAAVAETLAELGHVQLELVTVVGGADDAAVTAALEARARRSPVRCTVVVLQSEHVVASLEEHLASRRDALVVLASHARGVAGALVLGSVSEALLTRVDRPMLLVSPRVPESHALGESVIAGVADGPGAGAMLPWLAGWVRWIGGDAWVVQCAGPGDWRRTSADVARLADSLRARGVDAQWDILHGRSPAASLIDFATCMGGGIIIVASERWTEPGRVHWASTARSLVHRSPFPVLVVPLHRRPREAIGVGLATDADGAREVEDGG